MIDWQMDPQIALDPAHGDQPDLPNTVAAAIRLLLNEIVIRRLDKS